jgi:hypothetical protein
MNVDSNSSDGRKTKFGDTSYLHAVREISLSGDVV